jgi:GTP pyrophosphokinase
MNEYHPYKDFSVIGEVYEFALKAHGAQLRKSGEPYMIHPMSVALLLAEIRSDIETVAAGILHDVVEDTSFSYDDIRERFGAEIAELVRGVTKLKTLKYVSKEDEQAENFRQLFFSMSNDPRVILIKLCDRLHNLRTLEHMSPEHQKRKAQETLDIYAPLAHRLGISKIRYQLEDLSFRYLKPEEYFDLVKKMKSRVSGRQRFISDIVRNLKYVLAKEGIEAKVVGRAKHLFSIYKKMVSQDKTLDGIFDILAVRVIVGTREDCYSVLGIVHNMYTPIPGRVKDYIAVPKSNNYQSLHTTAFCKGSPFEAQIRTWEMNEEAEYGIAAHWKYKSRGEGASIDLESEEAKFAWLRHIIEWQMDMSDNKEYLAAVKDDLNIYRDHVYCFTPKGEVFNLLNGSTPIDFAYAIHSAVGNKMVGAKVNGAIVTFNYVLKNGDQVEILTSNNSRGPSRDWLSVVRTTEARSKINQWFRNENKEENVIKGKAMLEKEAGKKGADFYELIANKAWLNSVFSRYGMGDLNALYASVGHGGIKDGQIINRLLEERQKEQKLRELKENPAEALTQKPTDTQAKGKGGVLVQGQDGVFTRLSKCCHPLPGDEILAFLTRGRGAAIHRTDCSNILSLPADDAARLVEAEWAGGKEDPRVYVADLRLLCYDRGNLFVDISKVADGFKIVRISAKTDGGDAIFNISIEINDKQQLDRIMSKLGGVKGVYRVERA